MHRFTPLSLLTVLLCQLPASAGVLDSRPDGFTSRNTATILAPSAEVYAKLVQEVDRWWSSDHTFSGSAANLRLEARQGGCFCEALPNGGSVRHLTVVHADPGKLLRLNGGLGPLQAEAVTGSLSWALEDAEDGTRVTLVYAVGGYVSGGLDAWAEAVDGVVREQLERLARYIVTGDPERGSATPVPDGEVE